jgi:hypothetical protein
MYDFYYPYSESDPEGMEKYLIFIKRNLPRWVNSIPDSEYLTLYKMANKFTHKGGVIIETGSGASSLALLCAAINNNATLYTWDTNGSKLEFINNIAFQTIGKVLSVDVNQFWKTINFDSTSEELGIGVLKEFDCNASFAFLDSYHTLDHIMSESILAVDSFSEDAMLVIDDAYYCNKSKNYAYINIIRKKLGLNIINEPESNKVEQYHEVIAGFLETKYKNVESIDQFQKDYENDIYFDYFNLDRDAINSVGMEKKDELHNRYKIWKMNGKFS